VRRDDGERERENGVFLGLKATIALDGVWNRLYTKNGLHIGDFE
jgi:hypothetical protein